MPDDQQLLAIAREDYAGPYDDHLFEQYKMFVATAERISDRRAGANTFLIAVTTALATVYGLAKNAQPDGNWHIAVPLVGVFVSVTWWVLLALYKNVNGAKFEVIHELEAHLPARPFQDEWRRISRRHVPLSLVEQWIPAAFLALFAALFLFGTRSG